MRCPDCKKKTYPGEACEHCGCPLTGDALESLVAGLVDVLKEIPAFCSPDALKNMLWQGACRACGKKYEGKLEQLPDQCECGGSLSSSPTEASAAQVERYMAETSARRKGLQSNSNVNDER